MRLTPRSASFAFLGLAALCLPFADLHVAALDPWAEMARLGAGFLHPEGAAVTGRAAVLTVAFAVAGVGGGAVAGLALALAFACSRAVRWTAAALRSIHELFWALLLIQVTGLSPLTGVLAVALPYAGIFAKVYAEIMEEADLAAERVLPAGTPPLSRFAYARAPVLARAMRAYTLYRLECGLRSTLVLGFVGLPTIGFDLQSYFAQGDYAAAAALLLVFYLLMATRGIWASPLALPIVVPASVVVLAGAGQHLGGDPLAASLARFGAALVPEPLRHAAFAAHGWAGVARWLWSLSREQIVPGLANTLVLAQLSATLAALVALVAFPAISRRFSATATRLAGRALLLVLRGTPDYALAYVLLQLLGPSMLPAILALGLHNGGILGLLMERQADALALRRDAPVGLDLYAFECLPRLWGPFAALLLYRWEVILRESAILGILGVRTLGYHVDAALSELRLDRAAVLLVVTAGASLALDAGSRALRHRLRVAGPGTRRVAGPAGLTTVPEPAPAFPY